MNWLYYIPHDWEGKTFTTWEDVWLMPEIREISSESYWLTILSSGMEGIDKASLEKLGSTDYFIEDADMFVNKTEVSLTDILSYAKIWLQSIGFSGVVLVEGSSADFQDSNDDARAIDVAKELLKEIEMNPT